MTRAPFDCDLDGDAAHLEAADRAYRQGRVVIYRCKGMRPFAVQADADEIDRRCTPRP